MDGWIDEWMDRLIGGWIFFYLFFFFFVDQGGIAQNAEPKLNFF